MVARLLRKAREKNASILDHGAGDQPCGTDAQHAGAEAVLRRTSVLVYPTDADQRRQHAVDARGGEHDALGQFGDAHGIWVFSESL